MTPAAMSVWAMSGARHLWETALGPNGIPANEGNFRVPGYGDESVTP